MFIRDSNDLTQKKIKTHEFKFEGGINEFVEFLDEKRGKVTNKNDNDLFRKPIYIEGLQSNIDVFIEFGRIK